MPVFGAQTLSDQQVSDVAAYVQYLHHPDDRGGLGLGHLGPIPEGFVGWVVGMGAAAPGGPTDRNPRVSDTDDAARTMAPRPPMAPRRSTIPGIARGRLPAQDRPARPASPSGGSPSYWGITTVAALTLAGVYLAGGQPQLEGLLLMIALGSLGLGFVVFARDLLPGQRADRPPGRAPVQRSVRDAAEHAFERGEEPFVRRSFLLRMLGLAGGALGIAAVFPINSLGPHPGDTLAHTSWRKGSRLVTPDGRPVQLGDVAVDGVLTVFPEGRDRRRRQPDHPHQRGRRPPEGPPGPRRVGRCRATWPSPRCAPMPAAPLVCTARPAKQLLCPCHQSTFDVLDGCRPVFGPAARSLPQLPLAVRDDGFLVAQHDYTEPVGPGYWNRP